MILLDGKEYTFGSKNAPEGAGETFTLEITGEVSRDRKYLGSRLIGLQRTN